MKVERIDGEMATVGASGTATTVSRVFLDDLKTGDYVLVHAGFAIKKIDEKEAEETAKLLNEVFKL